MTTLQFIEQSFSEDFTSTKRRRRVIRATAARAGHVESRRVQMARYPRYEAQPGQSQLGGHSSQLSKVAAPGIIKIVPSSRKDPFTSFVRPFQPIEHFLLDHFVKAIVPLMQCNEVSVDYAERMTGAWVPLALSDAGLLSSLFLIACRHLSANTKQEQQREHYARLAVQYKLVCVRSVMAAISGDAAFRDATIAETVMLAYDELGIGDVAISRHHIDGAVRMVKMNGGPGTVGLDGLLEHLISNLCLKFEVGVYKPPEQRRVVGMETAIKS